MTNLSDYENFFGKAVPKAVSPPPQQDTIRDEDMTEDQTRVLQKVLDWYDSNPRLKPKKFFTVGGYAGTGKTTIIKKFLNQLGDKKVLLGAYTGKAVSVMRRKNLKQSQTLHSMIYNRVDDEASGRPMFQRVKSLQADLVVVDEGSMISTDIHEDLSSFGIPILYVGDHGQLEPIGENPNLMQKPDAVLEHIHRQAAGSEIIKLAERFRNGQRIVPNFRGSGLQIEGRSLFWDMIPIVDVAICGFNKTRHEANRYIRSHRKIKEDYPVEGEKVICLRNNRDLGIYNGQEFTVTRVVNSTEETHTLALEDELGNKWAEVTTLKAQYGEATMQTYKGQEALFDFGYCQTAHKSQGSEWKTGCVLEEIWYEKWSVPRWRYTTTTRMVDQLYYSRNN